MGIEGEITIGESRATRRDAITQEVTTVQANNLDINAENDVTLIGTEVLVADSATINANNVIIDAAREQTIVSDSHTSKTISSAGASYNSDTGEATLVSLTETDQTERTTTTDTTWSGSTINAGNLTINADESVAIIASDINVENNASIEAENILVGGREDTSNTTTDSITKTETLTVGVKNAYVDVVLAAKALDAAKDAVGDAKNAYDEAKQKVAEGKLPKSDLEFYKINLAAAQVGVANATLGVTSAGAAAAASTATYGFTATAGTSTQTDKTSTSITQGTWSGSSINVGGNTSLTSENNLTVEGSSVNTAGELNLDAQNINVIAGTNTYSESTESSSAGVSATVSTGGNFGGSVNASSSSSENQSTNYVNSSLSGGSIVSNSDSLTIEGGNLSGGEIDITTNTLVVTSLQDTSNSSNESQGGNVGFGSDSFLPSSAGVNASEGSSNSVWVNQQSGITGGTVNITAKDTSITGATIAAVDENGNTTDNLTLTTDTLTVANLEDTDTSKQMGIDLSYGGSSVTLGGNFSGHEKEQLTNATIGLGNVTVGGESIDEQEEFADLNRDVATSQEITKDIERGGLDASLTVDTRLFTEAGRQDIANDFVDTYEHGEDIGRTVATLAESDDLNILNLGETLHNNAMGTQLKNDLVRNPENAKLLAGLTSEDPEVKAQAYKDLGHLAQEKFGLELSDIDLYNGDKTTSASLANTAVVDVKGGVVVDSNNEEYGTIKLDIAGESEIGIVDTLGHEVLETQDLQGQSSGLGLIANSEDTQEALGDAFGAQFADRVNQAVDGGLSGTSNDFSNTYAVYQGTQEANKVGNAEVDHRQLYLGEAQAISDNAGAYADKYDISENQAKHELTQQALRQVDATWAGQIEENSRASEALAEIAEEIGDVSESTIGRSNVDILLDTESSVAFQANDQETFEDTNINAREVGLIEGFTGEAFLGEANFLSKYATENGEKSIDVGFIESGEQLYTNIENGISTTADAIEKDGWVEVVSETAKGLAEGAYDSITDVQTYKDMVFTDSEGSASDQQLVAELQGNYQAALEAGADDILETIEDYSIPGVGKAVKNSVETVAEEAVTVAAKKIDFVDTDGEMVGQDAPTYTGVIDQSKASDQLENTTNVPTYLYRKDTRGGEVYEQGGFVAKSPDSPVLLESYVDFGIDSKYIGTTKYQAVAESFNIEGISSNTKEGYVHVIDKDSLESTQRDVNLEIPSNPNYEEFEIAVENEIPSCSIIGCYKVDESGEQIGDFIRNPGYE